VPAGRLLSVDCDVMDVSSFIQSTPIRTFDDLMMAKTFFPTSIRSESSEVLVIVDTISSPPGSWMTTSEMTVP